MIFDVTDKKPDRRARILRKEMVQPPYVNVVTSGPVDLDDRVRGAT